jgi:hypothetical protein
MSACTACGREVRKDGKPNGWTLCRPCYERNKALRAQLEPLRIRLVEADRRAPLGPPRDG